MSEPAARDDDLQRIHSGRHPVVEGLDVTAELDAAWEINSRLNAEALARYDARLKESA